MVDPWLLRFNQQKKSGSDGEKSDKAFMRWSRSALPRSARDSKQRTTFMSPVF
jgi:hypothetical protein